MSEIDNASDRSVRSWDEIVEALHGVVEALDRPDREAAQRLVGLSQELVEAAAVEIGRAREAELEHAVTRMDDVRRRVEAVRGALHQPIQGLEPLRDALSSLWVTLSSMVSLDANEYQRLVATLDRVRQSGASVEQCRAVLKQAAAAVASEDTSETLTALDTARATLKDVETEAEAVVTEVAARIAALTDIIQDGAPQVEPTAAVSAPSKFEQTSESLATTEASAERSLVDVGDDDSGLALKKLTEVSPSGAAAAETAVSDETADEAVAARLELSLNAKVPQALEKLVARGEASLAYHLILSAAKLGIVSHTLPQADALALHNVGRTVRGTGGQGAVACRSSVEAVLVDLPSDTESDHDFATVLFAYSGALRPSLFAPESAARTLLEELPLGARLNFLHELRRPILELTQKGFLPTVTSLYGGSDAALARQRAEAERQRIANWVRAARVSKLVYAPATAVWHKLMASNGEIGKVVGTIADQRKEALRLAEKLLAEIKDENDARQLIERTDAALRVGLRRGPIEARARTKLLANVAEARDRIDAWRQASVVLAGEYGGAHEAKLANALRDALSERLMKADARLVEITGGPAVRAAVAGARQAFNELAQLLQGADDSAPLTYNFALHGGLLKLPGLTYTDGWVPVPYEPDLLIHRILDYAGRGPLTWRQALADRSEEGSHLATRRLIEIIGRDPDVNYDVDQLWQERQQAVAGARVRLARLCEELRREIDRALRLEDEADLGLSGLFDRLESIDPTALPVEDAMESAEGGEVITDFPAAFRLLAHAQASLDKLQVRTIERYRTRIAEVAKKGGETARHAERLSIFLERNDLLLVNEYLAVLETTGRLSDTVKERDFFVDFFPGFIDALHTKGSRFDTIRLALKNRAQHGPVNFSTFDEQMVDDARSLLGAWANVKSLSTKAEIAGRLKIIFEAIGFRDVRVSEDSGSGSSRTRRFILRTEPVANKEVCPVPLFGSLARGHYRVHLHNQRASESEILADIPAGPAGEANIAIYLGFINAERRRQFAIEAHEKRRSVLLLDEGLLHFLTAERGYRLPAFFSAGLPFGWGDPYTLKPGDIPTEVFYGRKREIEQLWDVHGPCLVYGGRQLGKSALLAQVRKLYHRPRQDVVVVVLDCRQIGRSEPISNIWQRMSAALVEHRIVEKGMSAPEEVTRAIILWINTEPSRRLLLLLDEMDKFLEKDAADDFRHVMVMKSLMEETHRRCKFVFAGLHDVQRAAKTVNTPLAHFGQAICVGPLYGTDLVEAQRLITHPLAAVGYSFQSEGLPLRILSDVNYYPSLVQIYCKQLVEHMGQVAFRVSDGPRYMISQEQVEKAFAGEQMRKLLVERLQMTLQLDKRYRLIALILTQRAIEDRNRLVDGYSLRSIRDEALDWWADGFLDASTDAFRTLLDEMTGLGVIKETRTGWTLRSAKVASMIGSPDSIEQDLLEFAEQRPEPGYDPQIYHPLIEGDNLMPSPLTLRQQYDLFQSKAPIVVVLGSPALGLGEVIRVLELSEPPLPVRQIGPVDDLRELGSAIGRAVQSGERNLLVNHPSTPWTPKWVRDLLQLDALKRRRIRVLFLGNGAAALTWLAERSSEHDKRDVHVTNLRPLGDQGLRLWLNDASLDILDTDAEREQLLVETGGCPKILESFAEAIRNLPKDWRQRRTDWNANQIKTMTFENFGVVTEMVAFVNALAASGVDFDRDTLELLPATMGVDLPLSPEESAIWAEALGILTPIGRQRWRLNPVVPLLCDTEAKRRLNK